MNALRRGLRQLARHALGALLALGLAAHAQAGGLDTLTRFLTEVRTGQGEFTQVVSARSGRKPQRSSGEFAFERPGRFLWTYLQPFPQQLIGDGKRLWSYDRDLNQVTVKTIGDALGATPAAILAGSAEISRNFELAEGGTSAGLTWVDARPLAPDSPFVSMRLGFAGEELKAMEIRDGFGQLTELRFVRFARNPRLDAGLFDFQPPAGADVVGE